MNKDKILREQIIKMLDGGNAHLKIIDAIEKFPVDKINQIIPGIEYTAWQLLEHMRIAQWDIVDFMKNPNYKHMDFPDDFWPEKNKTVEIKEWNVTYIRFKRDLEEVKKIAADESIDLFAPLPHAKEYNILRELLLIADHNAYHLGQLVYFIKSSIKKNNRN